MTIRCTPDSKLTIEDELGNKLITTSCPSSIRYAITKAAHRFDPDNERSSITLKVTGIFSDLIDISECEEETKTYKLKKTWDVSDHHWNRMFEDDKYQDEFIPVT